jgi:hypothetical protein
MGQGVHSRARLLPAIADPLTSNLIACAALVEVVSVTADIHVNVITHVVGRLPTGGT